MPAQAGRASKGARLRKEAGALLYIHAPVHLALGTSMSPAILFSVVLAYFLILLGVAWRTSRHATNDSFFIGNKDSNWMLVAFGMVGTTLDRKSTRLNSSHWE